MPTVTPNSKPLAVSKRKQPYVPGLLVQPVAPTASTIAAAANPAPQNGFISPSHVVYASIGSHPNRRPSLSQVTPLSSLIRTASDKEASNADLIDNFDSKPAPLLRPPRQSPSAWLCSKEFANVSNIIWLIAGATLALGIVATATLLTVYRCRQANADAAATTFQNGRFVSEACSQSSDCLENGVCSGGVCVCVVDYTYDVLLGACVPLRSYGQTCTDDRECNNFAHLRCVNGACSCPTFTFWANYYGSYDCIRTRYVGETCQASGDCITSAYCANTGTSFQCVCADGYYVSGLDGSCSLVKKVFEPCVGFYQECAPSSVCKTTNVDPYWFCYCIDGYYYSNVLDACTPLSTYGGWCFNSSQCQMVNLFCLSSVCTCNGTMYWNGTWCVPFVLYGYQCTSVSQCNPLDAYLTCGVPPNGVSQKVCYCRTGYIYDEYLTRCVAIKTVNTNCSSTSECISNAICAQDPTYNSTYVCQCVPSYYYATASNACVPMLTYAATCVSIECNTPLGLYCTYVNATQNTCQCLEDYYWNGAICVITHVYGDACATTPQDSCRTSRNLACNGATCACTVAHPTYDLVSSCN